MPPHKEKTRTNVLDSATFVEHGTGSVLRPDSGKMLIGLSTHGNTRCKGLPLAKMIQSALETGISELHLVVGDGLQEEVLRAQHPDTFAQVAKQEGDLYFRENFPYLCEGMWFHPSATERIVRLAETDVDGAIRLFNQAVVGADPVSSGAAAAAAATPRVFLSRWQALEAVSFDRDAVRQALAGDADVQRGLQETAANFALKPAIKARGGRAAPQCKPIEALTQATNYLTRELVELGWLAYSGGFDWVAYPGEIGPFFVPGIRCLMKSGLLEPRAHVVETRCLQVTFKWIQVEQQPARQQQPPSCSSSDDEDMVRALLVAQYPAAVKAEALCMLAAAVRARGTPPVVPVPAVGSRRGTPTTTTPQVAMECLSDHPLTLPPATALTTAKRRAASHMTSGATKGVVGGSSSVTNANKLHPESPPGEPCGASSAESSPPLAATQTTGTERDTLAAGMLANLTFFERRQEGNMRPDSLAPGSALPPGGSHP